MIVWLEPKVEFTNTSRRKKKKKKKKNEWQLHVFLATFHRYYFLDFYLIIDILFLKYQLYTEKFMNPKWSSLMNYCKKKCVFNLPSKSRTRTLPSFQRFLCHSSTYCLVFNLILMESYRMNYFVLHFFCSYCEIYPCCSM